MPTPRRINRSSPSLLSKSEQEAFVNAVEQRDEVLRGLEALLGVTWADLSFGEKVNAAQAYQESGRGAAVMAVAARAWRDLEELGDAATGKISLADELIRAREYIDQLRVENESLRQQVARRAS